MLAEINLEAAILINIARKYQYFKFTTDSSLEKKRKQQNNRKENKEEENNNHKYYCSKYYLIENYLKDQTKKMTTTGMKIKSMCFSLFQSSNSFMIQKSMKPIDKFEDDEYRKRRERNNKSVRNSREKNRIKLEECAGHVKNLENENTQLNQKLKNLQVELNSLKDVFQNCFTFNLNNLSFKPSDIPTSTLCKMIMKRDASTTSSPAASTLTSTSINNQAKSSSSNLMASAQIQNLKQQQSSAVRINSIQLALQQQQQQQKTNFIKINANNASTTNSVLFNQNDKFYINKLKDSLLNLDAKKLESTNNINNNSNNKSILDLNEILEENLNNDSSTENNNNNNTVVVMRDHDYSLNKQLVSSN